MLVPAGLDVDVLDGHQFTVTLNREPPASSIGPMAPLDATIENLDTAPIWSIRKALALIWSMTMFLSHNDATAVPMMRSVAGNHHERSRLYTPS